MATLDSTQQSNGEFHGQGKFNYSLAETRRRIVSFSVPIKGKVVFTLVNSTWDTNPFNGITNTTDQVKIENTAFDGTFKVAGVGTNTITIYTSKATTLTSGSTKLSAMATRVNSNGGNMPETRKLSSLRFQWNLTSTTNMCAMQNQVSTILSNFYKDPEVKREYSAKWTLYKSAWDGCGYGPTGDYDASTTSGLTAFIKNWMCLVFAESSWRASAMIGPEYLTKEQTISNYNNWYSANKPVGLWQVSSLSGANWWPNSYTNVDHNDVALPFSREYNTRIAIWIMFNRLFKSDLTNEYSKPFRSWAVPVSNNTAYMNCKKNMPPYPKTSPNCQDYVE